MHDEINIQTLHLFPLLDKKLIELLQSLTEDEWQAQTVASLWNVKDVAAHLLDGNLKTLSVSRDKYYGVKADNVNSSQELISFLNNLNLAWTNAAKRLSPQVLIELLTVTGRQYVEHLHTLNPFDAAVFSVAWAGQEVSPNWFHIAREYTEKFLHQQQIREAVNKPGIMTEELFYPFIDTFMHALPFTFKDVHSDIKTAVSVLITTDIGGAWTISKECEGWILSKGQQNVAVTTVTIDPDSAWKLFSKSRKPEQLLNKIEISGDRELGEQVLKMVAVMA